MTVPLSLVALRYLRMCLITFMCVLLGFFEGRLTGDVAKAMSGLVSTYHHEHDECNNDLILSNVFVGGLGFIGEKTFFSHESIG